MPSSVAVRQNGRRAEYPIDRIPADAPVMDLGMDSLATLVSTLKKSGTVVFNGPAGVFEDTDFATGTFELLRTAAKVEFSVVGGGHTAAVIEKLGIDNDFTHISTGGGACIEFLTGKKLPVCGSTRRILPDLRVTSSYQLTSFEKRFFHVRHTTFVYKVT